MTLTELSKKDLERWKFLENSTWTEAVNSMEARIERSIQLCEDELEFLEECIDNSNWSNTALLNILKARIADIKTALENWRKITDGWHIEDDMEDSGIKTKDVKHAIQEFVKELKGQGVVHLTPDKQLTVLEIPLYILDKLALEKFGEEIING